jgi:hypothetical protein
MLFNYWITASRLLIGVIRGGDREYYFVIRVRFLASRVLDKIPQSGAFFFILVFGEF